jgi:hypothetical protein
MIKEDVIEIGGKVYSSTIAAFHCIQTISHQESCQTEPQMVAIKYIACPAIPTATRPTHRNSISSDQLFVSHSREFTENAG